MIKINGKKVKYIRRILFMKIILYLEVYLLWTGIFGNIKTQRISEEYVRALILLFS